jgi:hypothetical protein
MRNRTYVTDDYNHMTIIMVQATDWHNCFISKNVSSSTSMTTITLATSHRPQASSSPS